jgi:hypothetical protein
LRPLYKQMGGASSSSIGSVAKPSTATATTDAAHGHGGGDHNTMVVTAEYKMVEDHHDNNASTIQKVTSE